jgi:mono/diheme cytochrome c family protein
MVKCKGKGTLAMISSVRTTIVVVFLFLTCAIALAQSGADTFDTKCVSCHGKNGEGKTAFGQKANIPDLGSPTVQAKSDRDLHDSIGRGMNHKQYPHAYLMRGMTEGQLNSVIAYIRSLKN